MASISSRTPYICERCIQHISRRPNLRQTRTALQWRHYAGTTSTKDVFPPRSSISRSRPEQRELSNSEDKAMSQLIAASSSTQCTSESPGTDTGASFRVAKHFNRDPNLQAARNMRAPYSALEVDQSDGNYMGYSRHRNPASVGRRRPIRKVRLSESKSGPEPEAELAPSAPSNWLPQKPPTHTKIKPAALEDCNWYWETLPPTIAHKTQATHFFVGRAAPKFLRSVAQFRMFPDSDVPEVAFVGRSNVGKSSLLNAIVNADTKALLAKTSSTPGFTKTMNLYGVGPGNGVNIVKQPSGHDKIIGTGGLTIVDMPGYGEGSLSEWGLEIMKYVQERKQLRRVFILLDAEHGIKDKDRSLLASLRLGGIPHQIILSKLDKIYIPKADSIKRADGKKLSKQKPRGSLEALQAVMKEIRSVIQPPVGGGAIGEILGCSSEVTVGNKRLGIDAVRVAVLQAAGLELGVKGAKKRDIGQLVRPVQTYPQIVRDVVVDDSQ